MSNTVKQCTNCKQSGSMYREWSKDFISYWEGFIPPSPIRYIQDFFPDISVSLYKEDYKNNVCPFCKRNLIDTLISDDDFGSIGEYSNYNRDLLLAMIELRKKDVIEFETKMQPFRQKQEEHEKEMERKTEERAAERDRVHCPKCGSTNIRTTNRGFLIVTGFIGSGSPRNVCQKCGFKWKPGGWNEALQKDLNRR